MVETEIVFCQVCRIAKLFAKHFKIKQQQDELSQRCVNIATGTPNRMARLVENKSLKLNRLELLILDCAVDAKQRFCLLINSLMNLTLRQRQFKQQLPFCCMSLCSAC